MQHTIFGWMVQNSAWVWEPERNREALTFLCRRLSKIWLICHSSITNFLNPGDIFKRNWEILRTRLLQCPRTDLNKKSLPRPKTTTEWKLIPHRSKISKNWNPPHLGPLHRFFNNSFLLIQKHLYNNYIQAQFTK